MSTILSPENSGMCGKPHGESPTYALSGREESTMNGTPSSVCRIVMLACGTGVGVDVVRMADEVRPPASIEQASAMAKAAATNV